MITKQDIYTILQEISLKESTHHPFPQANKIWRIIDLLSWMGDRTVTYEAIEAHNQFIDRQNNDRQGKYYGAASNYLQLTKEVATNTIALTSRGKDFLQQTPKNQTLLLIQAISEHPIFYQVLQLSLSAGHPLSKKEICKIMLHATETQQYQNSTIERRSSTVYSWILWIFEQMNGSLFDQIA